MREHDLMDLRRELEGLPTSRLREKIDKEIEKDVPDDELVLLILDILKVRDADKPLALTEGQKAIWNRHAQKLQNRARPRFRRLTSALVRVAAVIAVLGALVTVLPQTAAAGSMWKIIASWTSDIFRYENIGEEPEETVEADFRTDHPGLQEVYDALGELGIEPRPVPTWLPEGYELEWLEEIDTPAEIGVHVGFASGEEEIILVYKWMKKNLSPDFDKENSDVIELEYNGIIHSLIENDVTWTVNWTIQNLKCSIYVDCSEDVVRQIIKSIY